MPVDRQPHPLHGRPAALAPAVWGLAFNEGSGSLPAMVMQIVITGHTAPECPVRRTTLGPATIAALLAPEMARPVAAIVVALVLVAGGA